MKNYLKTELLSADKKRVFITHSGCSAEIVDKIRGFLESLDHFEEIFETRAVGIPDFPQRLCLNLADALPGDVKLLAHFFQRSGPSVVQTVAKPQHLGLPLRQRVENLHKLLPQHGLGHGVFTCGDFEQDHAGMNVQRLADCVGGESLNVGHQANGCSKNTDPILFIGITNSLSLI